MPAQLTAIRSGPGPTRRGDGGGDVGGAGDVTGHRGDRRRRVRRPVPSPDARSNPTTCAPAAARAAAVAAPSPEAAPVTMADEPVICMVTPDLTVNRRPGRLRNGGGRISPSRRGCADAATTGAGPDRRDDDRGLTSASPLRKASVKASTAADRGEVTMFLLRKPILALSGSSAVRDAVSKAPLTKSVVDRFIPGETTADAVAAVVDAARQGPAGHPGSSRRGHHRPGDRGRHGRRLPRAHRGAGRGRPGCRARRCR